MNLFDPSRQANRALIVGVSEYEHKLSHGVPGNLPEVQDNRTRLNDALHRGALFSEGQITMCPSPTYDGFWDALRRAAQEATGLLLFYFAGHGIVPVEGNKLFLQMRNARVVPGGDDAFPGAAAITHVLDELANSEAERIVVILDCCYAGNAAESWHNMRDSHRKRKILLLMSVQSNRCIKAKDGGKGTPFTRELAGLLEQQRDLSLLTLYRELREHVQTLTVEGERQEPQGVWAPDEDVLLRKDGAGPIEPDRACENPPVVAPPRRRSAFIGITCLVLLAAGGYSKIISDYMNDGGPGPSAPTTSAGATASSGASASFAAEENKKIIARLREAQAGNVTWVVGVKRNQPGLSEQKEGGEWSGKEIEYAEVILDELGVKKYKFLGVGSDARAEMLNEKKVDIFIGTYGVSSERKMGTSEYPAVIFAGPYFETSQKVMLEHYPKSKNPHEARIQGKRVSVRSINDIPRGARLCVVKGSSAERYLKQDKPTWSHVAYRTDYNQCVDNLDSVYDAVPTDELILQYFDKGNKYFIADDGFGHAEKYGIGLNVNAIDLKREICKKMIKTLPERDGIYKDLAGGGYSPPALDECN